MSSDYAYFAAQHTAAVGCSLVINAMWHRAGPQCKHGTAMLALHACIMHCMMQQLHGRCRGSDKGGCIECTRRLTAT